jgi:hypothetical protein
MNSSHDRGVHFLRLSPIIDISMRITSAQPWVICPNKTGILAPSLLEEKRRKWVKCNTCAPIKNMS